VLLSRINLDSINIIHITVINDTIFYVEDSGPYHWNSYVKISVNYFLLRITRNRSRNLQML